MDTTTSPITFASSAFAINGEVDEANLFLPDDATPQIDEAALVAQEAQRELNALLEEAIAAPNDEGDEVAAEQEAGELDDLDQLLEESMAPMRAKQETKAFRDQLARGGLSKAERLAIEAKVREWEARVEWEPQANVALFFEQRCKCGQVSLMFGGLLERQIHRRVKSTQRWVSTTVNRLKLPNEIAMQELPTPMCFVCCDGKGYDWGTAKYLDHPKGD